MPVTKSQWSLVFGNLGHYLQSAWFMFHCTMVSCNEHNPSSKLTMLPVLMAIMAGWLQKAHKQLQSYNSMLWASCDTRNMLQCKAQRNMSAAVWKQSFSLWTVCHLMVVKHQQPSGSNKDTYVSVPPSCSESSAVSTSRKSHDNFYFHEEQQQHPNRPHIVCSIHG